LKKIFVELEKFPAFSLMKGKAFKTAQLEKVELSNKTISPHFSVHRSKDDYEIECFVKPDGVAHALDENESLSPLLFFYNHQLYLWDNKEAVETAERFLPNGIIKIKSEDWPLQLAKSVLPLSKEYKVDFERSLINDVKDGEPEVKLFLNERGEYLMFQPVFTYKGYDTKAKDKDELIIPHGDKVVVVHRNRMAERAFLDRLQTFQLCFF
jgi:non-specific serine/threonine protein kinase